MDSIIMSDQDITSDNLNLDTILPKIEVEDNLDEIIMKEKQGLLDRLFDMYPSLETNRKDIVKNCLTKKAHKSEEEIKADYTNNNEIILEKICIDQKNYYKDRKGSIWDQTAQVCGVVDSTGSEPKYVLFENHDIDPVDPETFLH